MGRGKTIVSIGVVFFSALCIYLFFLIQSSSLRFENNKMSVTGFGQNADFNRPMIEKSWFANTFIHAPLELELTLRSELIRPNRSGKERLLRIYKGYRELLSKKPTWPYYYSGLAQLSGFDKEMYIEDMKKAIRFGYHESKVVYSLAEVVFYHWNSISETDRNILLGYLSNQADSLISQVVKISAKFARLYEYCDFLYEKKQVKYAACKRQYWQPLLHK